MAKQLQAQALRINRSAMHIYEVYGNFSKIEPDGRISCAIDIGRNGEKGFGRVDRIIFDMEPLWDAYQLWLSDPDRAITHLLRYSLAKQINEKMKLRITNYEATTWHVGGPIKQFLKILKNMGLFYTLDDIEEVLL